MGWKKLFYTPFNTGTFTVEEPCSWSRTSLQNMYGVDLVECGKTLSIRGTGDYWQSDTFAMSAVTGRSKMIKRRIEFKVPSNTPCSFIDLTSSSCCLEFKVDTTRSDYLDFSKNVDEWLILEIDMETTLFKYYFSGEKI